MCLSPEGKHEADDHSSRPAVSPSFIKERRSSQYSCFIQRRWMELKTQQERFKSVGLSEHVQVYCFSSHILPVFSSLCHKETPSELLNTLLYKKPAFLQLPHTSVCQLSPRSVVFSFDSTSWSRRCVFLTPSHSHSALTSASGALGPRYVSTGLIVAKRTGSRSGRWFRRENDALVRLHSNHFVPFHFRFDRAECCLVPDVE